MFGNLVGELDGDGEGALDGEGEGSLDGEGLGTAEASTLGLAVGLFVSCRTSSNITGALVGETVIGANDGRGDGAYDG